MYMQDRPPLNVRQPSPDLRLNVPTLLWLPYGHQHAPNGHRVTAPYYEDGDTLRLYTGHALDVLATLPDQSVNCIVTSPPYFGLRSYGDSDDEMGTEKSPTEFVAALVAVFHEARRVLADDGVMFLNLGDSYATSSASGPQGKSGQRAGRRFTAELVKSNAVASGLPAKNLLMIPAHVAIALQDDGWILRNDIIWAKPNGMPESVTDRLSNKHEHVFMFSKKPRYWFNLDPIREPHVSTPDRAGATALRGQKAIRPSGPNSGQYNEHGRNPGDVWTIATQPFPGPHYAVYPVALPDRCIQAGCKPGGTVLDPFSGSGTTGLAASRHGMKYVGIDLYASNHDLALTTRLAQGSLLSMEDTA